MKQMIDIIINYLSHNFIIQVIVLILIRLIIILIQFIKNPLYYVKRILNNMKDQYYLYKIRNDLKFYPKDILRIINEYNPTLPV